MVWLAAATALLACARHRATLGPGAPLVTGGLITVIPPDQDPADVQSQLERLLLQRGLRVMHGGAGSVSPIGEARVPSDIADYALSYNYATRSELGANDVFWNFSAVMVDLRTGALVAAAVPERRELNGKKVIAILRQFIDDIPLAKK